MATAQSVKAKLQGLIDSANAATGGSDTTLDAAVGTLIAGFGAGGGGSSAIYSGSFTPAENVLTATIDVGGDFTNFVIFTKDEFKKEVKSFRGAYLGFGADGETDFCYYVPTNNAGTSVGSGGTIFSAGFAPVKNGNIINFTNMGSGSSLGYFLAGNTYQWFAW